MFFCWKRKIIVFPWRACRLRGVLCAAALLAALLAPWHAVAQAPVEEEAVVPVRTYHLLRYDDDWSFLRDPALRQDWLDPIKFIALNGGGTRYLSLGGEFRQTAENVRNDVWQAQPHAINTFTLQRIQLHVDAHLAPSMRFFLQVESGLEQGREPGPRPVDLKRLDFLNAFADFAIDSGKRPITLRVGRQEVMFGSGRLVAAREGPNVRRGFYGARLHLALGPWQSNWFALRPTADNPGFFDNVPQQTVSFWGVFAERPWKPASLNLLDLYYFGLDRKHATFNRGTGREQRHTLGVRIASRDPASTDGRRAVFHFDEEAMLQVGSFSGRAIRAWTVASELGVILPALPFKPRVGLRANVTSGDRGAPSHALGTFNPLFPVGNYFGILADTGPGPLNSRDLHPNIRLFFPRGVSLNADWLIWWRQSLDDGVYSIPGNLIVASGPGRARFVGHRPGIEARWQIDRHAYLQADYGVFFAGPFLRQSGRHGNLNYASLWLGYKF